jgi:hypothetical protein
MALENRAPYRCEVCGDPFQEPAPDICTCGGTLVPAKLLDDQVKAALRRKSREEVRAIGGDSAFYCSGCGAPFDEDRLKGCDLCDGAVIPRSIVDGAIKTGMGGNALPQAFDAAEKGGLESRASNEPPVLYRCRKHILRETIETGICVHCMKEMIQIQREKLEKLEGLRPLDEKEAFSKMSPKALRRLLLLSGTVHIIVFVVGVAIGLFVLRNLGW